METKEIKTIDEFIGRTDKFLRMEDGPLPGCDLKLHKCWQCCQYHKKMQIISQKLSNFRNSLSLRVQENARYNSVFWWKAFYEKYGKISSEFVERNKQFFPDAGTYFVAFALREQVGGRGNPYLCFWILQAEESWHDAVAGDGGSYRSGGPQEFESKFGESLEEFEQRVESAIKEWENQN